MTGGISASPTSSTIYSPIPSTTQSSRCHGPSGRSSAVISRLSREHHRLCSSILELKPNRFAGVLPSISLRCNSSSRPGGPGPGESDSRNVLDAFFLGKALAEALNERIESTVGELLSALGRLQAEQQKQVQDFQEDVLERAKRAKEKAVREAMEAQGLIPKSSTANVSAVVNGDTPANVTSATVATSETSPTSSNASPPDFDTDPGPNNKDHPLSGVSNEG